MTLLERNRTRCSLQLVDKCVTEKYGIQIEVEDFNFEFHKVSQWQGNDIWIFRMLQIVFTFGYEITETFIENHANRIDPSVVSSIHLRQVRVDRRRVRFSFEFSRRKATRPWLFWKSAASHPGGTRFSTSLYRDPPAAKWKTGVKRSFCKSESFCVEIRDNKQMIQRWKVLISPLITIQRWSGVTNAFIFSGLIVEIWHWIML